jgi:hypothetical protein
MPTTQPMAKSSEAQTFLTNLKGGREFPLKHIARALYNATGGRQEALLTLLKKGEMIASAYWPSAGTSTELPASLWAEIQPSQFRIRSKRKGNWRTASFSLPSLILVNYLALPLVHQIKNDQLTPTDREQLMADLIGMLESKIESANVCVTFANARAYAETHLASARSRKKVGRPKTLDSNLLLLEAMRRLYLQSPLPSQKHFVSVLTEWWNSDPYRAACSTHWVEKHVKGIWATLKPR